MKRSQFLNKTVAIIVAFIIMGIAMGLISSQIVARQKYKNMAQILGFAVRIDPQMEIMMIRALKEADFLDFSDGDAILKEYNYSLNVFRNQNTFRMTVYGILLATVPAILVIVIGYLSLKKKKERIEGLTDYLKAVNLGQEALLLRQEDDFSLLEDELYKTVTELRQTKENAVRERRSLADNLTDISHQLKTPITSMSLMTQLLSENPTDEDRIYIEKLNHQLNRLETLVSSLLTLSKLDAGTLEFKQEPVNIFAVLALAAEPVEDMILKKGQQLIIPHESDVNFMGDMSWTAEALLNLIKNCSEYTPDGGNISINYSQNPLYMEIIIEDSGKGFDKNDLPHLFERFYKGKNSSKDGIGIGLALSKSIIERQKGTLRAENSPKGGGRFIIKFYV
ncbi:sensor histidine kinase [Sporanaerobacter sp. PP17-6a]|jgi:signal transduction histidine kinase|uniref:sensor histidine kinase n=1 Tax=Sporanaerobacter sp. PP17-6a TaxID=1891289 RepID=UPI0008A031C5|nr:HAMP domain-containing sensor histidine kinase [Sporanaerobacter sp. PP17-6a]MBE6081170.1 HAMP domain-containing histidine kinase [Tissierellaceae bacterium]SCL86462.1 Signal-transduction histidine kinase senX3 [Sporanaerobacter sp. PP17-6a]